MQRFNVLHLGYGLINVISVILDDSFPDLDVAVQQLIAHVIKCRNKVILIGIDQRFDVRYRPLLKSLALNKCQTKVVFAFVATKHITVDLLQLKIKLLMLQFSQLDSGYFLHDSLDSHLTQTAVFVLFVRRLGI